MLCNWIASTEVVIYKYFATITSKDWKAYYRPALGCDCKCFYDGLTDLLFNLDNKHIFYYDMLFQYLDLMIEGRNPFVVFYRSSVRSHATVDITHPPTLDKIRSAWYAFARLLDIDWKQTFLCTICGYSPETIICDGTLLGFRKDFLPSLLSETEEESVPVTYGSKHNDRVFVHSTKGRELLLRYSGYSKDRKKLSTHSYISANDFKTLVTLLEKDSTALSKLVDQLYKDTGEPVAPFPYSKFFSELARNSPVCGIF